MRGLTPLEREVLANRAAGGPRVSYPPDHPCSQAFLAMVSVGRMTRDEHRCGAATDLGRLALRVCPVGEP